MNQVKQRLQELSPERRALVMKMLREKQADRRAIPTLGDRRSQPLALAQERLWFLELLQPNSSRYNCPCSLELTGLLDLVATEGHIDAIFRRHEVLRTSFAFSETGPTQIIGDPKSRNLPVVDLSGLPKPLIQETTRRLSKQESNRPFQLDQGPLLRTTLIRSGSKVHVALLTMHHIIADDRSVEVLIAEIATHYGAFASGRKPHFPQLSIQYLDFAVWQRQWLRGERSAVQTAYWQRQLEDLSVLRLPRDYPLEAEGEIQGATLFFKLPPALVGKLFKIGMAEKASMFMVMLATLQALLAKYTAQEDIAVGTPVANRNRPQLENLIGFFVNMLVMRARFLPKYSFREFLHKVRETALAAFEHQDVPFDKVVEIHAPEVGQTENPLFQVMFVYLSAPAANLDLPGLRVKHLKRENIAAKFPLTLTLVEEGTGLSAAWEYDPDRFERQTIERLSTCYQNLLNAVAATADIPLGDLSLLDSHQRHHILAAWNDTQIPGVPDKCLRRCFDEQVAKTPEASALSMARDDDGKCAQITYSALSVQANLLAQRLAGIGVGLESTVGICTGRSIQAYVGILAILKAGAAYLPLDPAYPMDRLQFMIEDAGVEVLLTASLEEPLPRENTGITLDITRPIRNGETPERPCQTGSHHRAYLIYTSGSTGRPKGVVGLHGTTLNRLNWMWRRYPFAAGEVACQKTSLNFVDSIWELFGPLLAGVPSLILNDQTTKSPTHLSHVLTTHQVTRIVLVPLLLKNLIDIHTTLENPLPRLKTWVVSGEALLPELVDQFQTRFHNRRLLNLYGSSEVAADVTCYDTGTDGVNRAPVMPIGRPIDNTRIHIMGPENTPLPPGIPGELHVGGHALARGYAGRPGLTAAKFVPDPFAGVTGGKAGDRLYKTGDMASYLPDGNILFVGRSDLQVQVNGHRIEPEEIESVLREHPKVKSAFVQAVDASQGARLRAAVVPSHQASPSKMGTDGPVPENEPTLPRSLRDFTRVKLPPHMVPAEIMVLERFPELPNGKLDRAALVEHLEESMTRQPMTKPETDTEQQLAAIWQRILPVEEVSRSDRILDLGANSIHLAQIHMATKQLFPARVTVTDLFDNPTLAELAAQVKPPEPETAVAPGQIQHLDF